MSKSARSDAAGPVDNSKAGQNREGGLAGKAAGDWRKDHPKPKDGK